MNVEFIDGLFGNDIIRLFRSDSWHKVYLPHVTQLWQTIRKTPLDLNDGSAMLLTDTR